MAPHVMVLHGPNLNLLGVREPGVYGQATLAEIDRALDERARARGATVECHQSNIEGELVDKIQSARGRAQAIIINPAIPKEAKATSFNPRVNCQPACLPFLPRLASMSPSWNLLSGVIA